LILGDVVKSSVNNRCYTIQSLEPFYNPLGQTLIVGTFPDCPTCIGLYQFTGLLFDGSSALGACNGISTPDAWGNIPYWEFNTTLYSNPYTLNPYPAGYLNGYDGNVLQIGSGGAVLGISVCPSPTPTPTNTTTPTNTITPTPTRTSAVIPVLSPTPTETPTETPTQTPTPTNTETPTQTPTLTQTKTPTPTSAPCSTFTLYNSGSTTIINTTYVDCSGITQNTGNILSGQTITLCAKTIKSQTNLVITNIGSCPLPTPTTTATPTITPTQTTSPTPSCNYYQAINDSLSGTLYYGYTDCDGNVITYVELPPSSSQFVCGRVAPYYMSGVNSLSVNDLGICPTPTPTPSITPTNTPTPSITPTNTITPSITPSNTPSITPSITPTNTQTPTKTPTQTPTSTPTSVLLSGGTTSTFSSGGTTYRVHTFTSNGTISVIRGGFVELLVVAGGGGGGGGRSAGGSGGGGGGGGTLYLPSFLVSSSSPVSIGNGGAGGGNSSTGTNGDNSVVFGQVAFGGGGGGCNTASGSNPGLNGGAGGGAACGSIAFGTGVAGQGTDGLPGGGNGGSGTYAGYSVGGTGNGCPGGGVITGANGAANTGNGGGGGVGSTGFGGSGGSGIIKITYAI